MSGSIYFLASEHGAIKIGFSRDIEARVRSIQTSHPGTLTLIGHVPGSVEAERQLHEVLADFRVTGEWFRDCEDVRSIVRIVLADGASSISSHPAEPADVGGSEINRVDVPPIKPRVRRYEGEDKVVAARRIVARIVQLERVETGTQRSAIARIAEWYGLSPRWIERLVRNEPHISLDDALFERLLDIYEEQLDRFEFHLEETKLVSDVARRNAPQALEASRGAPEHKVSD